MPFFAWFSIPDDDEAPALMPIDSPACFRVDDVGEVGDVSILDPTEPSPPQRPAMHRRANILHVSFSFTWFPAGYR